MRWSFFAAGRPRTKGSVHAFAIGGKVIRKDSNPATKAWAGVVACAADLAGVSPLDAGVSISLAFLFARPANHYGSGRNATALKASAPAHPTTRSFGDLDKLERAVLDALTGIAYGDDSQVVRVESSKAFAGRGEPEGVFVTVRQA